MTQLQNQFQQSAEKGLLDLKMGLGTLSCQVDSTQATALVPGQAVKLVDSLGGVPKVIAVAADTDKIFGFVAFTFKDKTFPALSAVEISVEGNIMYLQSSAAVARGAKLMYVVAGKKVATATNGKSCVGFSLDKASVADQLIKVWLQPFSSAAIAGQAADVAAIGVTAALTALVPVAATITDLVTAGGNTYSDAAINAMIVELKAAYLLKADNADVETLRGQVEARIDVIEAKVDGYRTALQAAGLMA